MAIAETTRGNDFSLVKQVLDSSDSDKNEEASIESIASKIQTDDEKNEAVNQMILKEKI